MIHFMPSLLRMVLLLTASSVFMTFAGYGRLKCLENRTWFVDAFVSRGIALFEHLLQAPGKRIGYEGSMSLVPLKLAQVVLSVCLVGAVYFVFRSA